MGKLFEGRMQVPYYYSCFGYTRGNGKTWHGGQDVVGLDSDTILMPDYDGKSISGTVITARKVDKSTGNRTWEWGWYVCVQLDANQTPDKVNYLYFCHNSQNLVRVGQKVKSGDALAVMGNSGNAAEASPPIKHCHLEVRATVTGAGLDPTHYSGCANRVGIYGENPVKPLSGESVKLKIYSSNPISAGDVVLIDNVCKPLGITTRAENGALVTSPASSGDQITIISEAKRLNLSVALYNAAPSKVQVMVDSLRVRTGPGVTEYTQVGSVKKGEVLETLQIRDGWAYVVTGEKDGWICLGEDGEVYAKAV